VEIVAVHVDAVLEIPYYTIQLPNKTRKKTSWDNLMTLAEYKKAKSTSSTSGTDHDGKADIGGNGDGSRRSRSLSRLTSRLRGSSSQRQQPEENKESQRSTSRNNRRRSSSHGGGVRSGGDNHSTTSSSSRRSQSPYRSTRSHSSSRRSSSRNHHGRSNSNQRRNNSLPRSQSPFQRFIEDGKSKEEEEKEDHRDRHRSRRSDSSKRQQVSSSRHPMDSLTSIMAVAETPVDSSSARRGGKAVVAQQQQHQHQQRRRSSSGSPPYIKSCYLAKDGHSNDCKAGESGCATDFDVNTARKQELLNASCGTLIVVEDVTEDSDDDELFSIEK
jgi:hypothetical protein